jgi:hypothetical protein
LELRPLRKKTSSVSIYLRNVIIVTFVLVVGVTAIFVSNYLATTEETTRLSEASTIIRCGYVEDQCVQLAPGIFGPSTHAETKNVCKQQNGICIEEKLETKSEQLLPPPKLLPSDGTKFVENLEISIEIDEYPEGVEIFYKINDGKYIEYESPFEINSDSIIRTKALHGTVTSEVAEYKYILDLFEEEDEKDEVVKKIDIECSEDNGIAKLTWDPDKRYPYYRVFVDRADNGLTIFDSMSYDRDTIVETNEYSMNVVAGVEYKKWGVLGGNNLSELNVDLSDEIIESKILYGEEFTCGESKYSFNIFLPEYTNESKYTIQGNREFDSRIFVNESEVEYKSELDWEYEIDLEIGLNEINVKFEYNNQTEEVQYFINYCEVGDINCDGLINIIDLQYFFLALHDYQRNSTIDVFTSSLVDIGGVGESKDGKINVADFVLFQQNYSNNR